MTIASTKKKYSFTHDIIIRADLTDSNYKKKIIFVGFIYYFDYIGVFLETIYWHGCVMKSKYNISFQFQKKKNIKPIIKKG